MLFAIKILIISIAMVSQVLAFACGQTEEFRVGQFHIVLPDQMHGSTILSSSDDFIESLNLINRQVRAYALNSFDDQSYLEYLGTQATCWTSLEKKQLKMTLTMIDKRLRDLGIHVYNAPIAIVKTLGGDEINLPYTRQGNIFIPKGKLSYHTLLHELFHVLSFQHSDMRSELYALINFLPANNLVIPQFIADKILVNPDALSMNHYIQVTNLYTKKTLSVVPLIILNKQSLNNMERFLKPIFSMDSIMDLKLYDIETETLVDPYETNYTQATGQNTTYIIHPEEILAENFALMLMDNYTFSHTPQIVEALKNFFVNSF